MGLQDNTKVKTRLPISDVIHKAYGALAYDEEVPWTRKGSNFQPGWTIGYDKPETKEGMYVEFWLKERPPKPEPEPDKPYQAGDWIDSKYDDSQ